MPAVCHQLSSAEIQTWLAANIFNVNKYFILDEIKCLGNALQLMGLISIEKSTNFKNQI